MSLRNFLVDILKPGFSIARYALGKYIILAASFVHLFWALLLSIDVRAANATAVSILYFIVGHSRFQLIFFLVFISGCALIFLNYRVRRRIGDLQLTLLLIPQQLLLLCSAGAGIYAAFVQHYADGTPMSWPHIIADQTPTVILAILYTIAVIESLYPPRPFRIFDQ